MSNSAFTSFSDGKPLPRAKLCSAEPASNEERFGFIDWRRIMEAFFTVIVCNRIQK